MKKILTAILCVFMCTAMVFSVGCSGNSLLNTTNRLIEENFYVDFIDSEESAEMVNTFTLENTYKTESFEYSIEAYHDALDEACFVIIIVCKEKSIAEQIVQQLEGNRTVLEKVMDERPGELVFERKGSIVYFGHREAISIVK